MPIPARLNPFAVERVHRVRYRLPGFAWDAFLADIERLNFRAAILGLEGAGKTTLQIELAERLEQQGDSILWVRLSTSERIISENELRNIDQRITPKHIIMFDGLEQLAWWRWKRFDKRFRHRAKGLIATTHFPGRLPVAWTCPADVAILKEIVAELQPGIDDGLLQRLFDNHDGNLRLCLRDLYDMAADGVLA